MTVENTNTIKGLNVSLPNDTDFLAECDNHLRQLKTVEKNIFRGVDGNGFNKPILASESDLNFLKNLTSDIEVQLQDLRNGETPIGGIQLYSGSFVNIPERFFLCDGANGTPNLSNQFVLGGSTVEVLGVAGGSADDVVISHTHSADHSHTGSSDTTGLHAHTQPYSSFEAGSFNVLVRIIRVFFNKIKTLLGGIHTHPTTMPNKSMSTSSAGTSPINTNIPQYYKSAFVMRVS